ncbi:unnamed protein product [Spirodela intermedia]|uniref:Reticulon domain-containing protein n=1 Tax=Spirodela intermedia TaxID=51605 RepID=A0A7I8LFJ5_SPIIN|nr:unnamed protein product [Spirodela intermedia]
MAGSIWETRMKLDEVKGGIKVFTEEESREGDEDEGGVRVYNLRLRRNQSEGGGGDRRKRKNWSPPEVGNVGAGEKSPSSNRLRKTQSLLPNSPKIEEEKAVEGGLSNAAQGKEIEIEMEERRRSFDDKEMVVAGKKNDQICDKSVSSNADEKMPDAAERKQAVDLGVERSSPEAAASLDVIPAPASPLPLAIEAPPERSPPKVIEMRPPVMDEGFYETMTEAEHRMQSIGVLVSAISYLGLIYLAAIFFFNSILRRGTADSEEKDRSCMLGEEDAIRVVRLLLPYVNELLINLKALFSGDPATTMKLALMLFFLARCGGTITCWTMAKMAFFGVFTIPKICSSYSVQLARFGKFWLERVKDAWESCQHKKAVATGVFTLTWNLSSAVARMWAVFMLMVAVRLYQQRAAAAAAEEDEEEEAAAMAAPPRRVETGHPLITKSLSRNDLHSSFPVGRRWRAPRVDFRPTVFLCNSLSLSLSLPLSLI